MKRLKREEIYPNHYVDLEHLRSNIETFIEAYYTRLMTPSSVFSKKRVGAFTKTVFGHHARETAPSTRAT